MKPFYGIDRTALKKSTYHEGDCFIAATVSGLTRDSYQRALQGGAEQLEQTRLPLLLRCAKAVCGWVAALIFLGILKSDATLTEGYANAPFLFWACGICGVLWALLAVLSRRKSRAVTGQEEFGQAMRRLEGEIDRIHRELGVPETAKEVDVVQLAHRWKDGKLKIHTQGMETTPYTNVSMLVFRREDMLCFVDLENRYELPISELRCLRRVKKPLMLQGWNKAEKLNSEFYKPYKLSMDSYERVHTRAYGLLELNHEGVDWAVWLPPYELNYISALTGLPITDA